MLYRKTFLEERSVIADSGTRTTDISVRDPITALWVEFRATNGASGNRANTLAECVSAIEVVDGADVLYSLDGRQALALTCYHLGHMPNELVAEIPTLTQNLSVLVPFGRYLGDPYLAFDPSRFTNPQVRVKWNLGAVRAVGADSFVSNSGTLTVMADVLEGGPTPTGFLMSKEHYAWAGAASGNAYVDLPTDYPYRGLLVQGLKAATNVFGVLSVVKLSCDAGKHVPFEMRMTDLLRYTSMSHAPFAYKHHVYAKNGDTLYTLLKHEEIVNLNPEAGDTVVAYQNYGYGQGALGVTTGGSAAGAPVNLYAHVSGFAPWANVWIPLGDPDTPDDWFPAPTFGSFRATLTQAAASANNKVALQQLRGY